MEKNSFSRMSFRNSNGEELPLSAIINKTITSITIVLKKMAEKGGEPKKFSGNIKIEFPEQENTVIIKLPRKFVLEYVQIAYGGEYEAKTSYVDAPEFPIKIFVRKDTEKIVEVEWN